jgi:hypothetical protein
MSRQQSGGLGGGATSIRDMIASRIQNAKESTMSLGTSMTMMRLATFRVKKLRKGAYYLSIEVARSTSTQQCL